MYSVYKYNALTEDEIVMAVSRLDKDDKVEDDELIADEPAIPSYSEVYAWLSICVWDVQSQRR